MDNLDFLKHSPPGNATVFVLHRQGKPHPIVGLNLNVISQKAPLLGATFEDGRNGPRCSIEGSNPNAIISLLRFLYIGDYRLCDELIDQPCSQLVHFQLYHFGVMYDIPDLCNLARLHTIRETELACSTGRAPPQLAKGIRYLYQNLLKHNDLREIIVHYCINCFCYHHLDTDPDFRQTVYETLEFHHDLLRVNLNRGFIDEGAQTLVQLPVCRHTPHPDADLQQRALGDYLYELMGESASEDYKKTKPPKLDHAAARSSWKLAYRTHMNEDASSLSKSSFPQERDFQVQPPSTKSSLSPPQATRSCTRCRQMGKTCLMTPIGTSSCMSCMRMKVTCDPIWINGTEPEDPIEEPPPSYSLVMRPRTSFNDFEEDDESCLNQNGSADWRGEVNSKLFQELGGHERNSNPPPYPVPLSTMPSHAIPEQSASGRHSSMSPSNDSDHVSNYKRRESDASTKSSPSKRRLDSWPEDRSQYETEATDHASPSSASSGKRRATHDKIDDSIAVAYAQALANVQESRSESILEALVNNTHGPYVRVDPEDPSISKLGDERKVQISAQLLAFLTATARLQEFETEASSPGNQTGNGESYSLQNATFEGDLLTLEDNHDEDDDDDDDDDAITVVSLNRSSHSYDGDASASDSEWSMLDDDTGSLHEDPTDVQDIRLATSVEQIPLRITNPDNDTDTDTNNICTPDTSSMEDSDDDSDWSVLSPLGN